MNIQLSDHFTYRRLIRFAISTVLMLICTSMYSIVDGLFVSNYVGKMPFAATNLIWPVSMGIAAIRGFRLFSFSFLIMGINIWASSFFTALNNGFVSAVISFLRTFLFQVAAVCLLPLIIGIDGVWTSVLAAEAMALAVTVVFLIKEKKKYRY